MRAVIRRAGFSLAVVAGAGVLTAGLVTAAVAATGPVTGSETSPAGIDVTQISCASPGNCSATGQDQSNNLWLLTETAGTWAPAVAATLPADGASLAPEYGSALTTFSQQGTAQPTDPPQYLDPVSCSSPGNCTVVGLYYPSGQPNAPQGFVITETAGTWAPAAEAPLPNISGEDFADYTLSLNSVSCSSPGNCAAVGSYYGPLPDEGISPLLPAPQGLMLTETDGIWTAAEALTSGLPVPLYAGASELNSVSCPSDGNCTAVGWYLSRAAVGDEGDDPFLPDGGGTLNLIVTEASGSWTAATEALPHDYTNLPAHAPLSFPPVPGLPTSLLSSVSCTSDGNCTAVGQEDISDAYENTWTPADDPVTGLPDLFGVQGLILTETAGTWAYGQWAPMPANAEASAAQQANYLSQGNALPWDPQVQMTGLSCGSAGNCTAIATYWTPSGNPNVPEAQEEALGAQDEALLTDTAGTWTATQAALPSDAFNPTSGPYYPPYDQPNLESVSCGSATTCTVAATYETGTSTDPYGPTGRAGELLTETSGTWAAPVEVDPPANAYSPSVAALSAVSCPSASYCAAAGQYLDDDFGEDGWLVSQGPPADLSIAQPANITTDATGPSGATVSYPLPAVTDPAGSTPTTTCTPASGTVFAAGTTTVTCTATDPNDANSPVSTTFTVTVIATPVITWPTPASIVYGTPLGPAQLDATASVAGAASSPFVYSPPAGTVLAPGANQPLTVTFTPADTTDYTTATATVNISVTTSPCITSAMNSALVVAAGTAGCVSAGGTVNSHVTIQPGGALSMTGGTINGTLTASGATAISLCGVTINGSVTITGATGPVLLGAPGCKNKINGQVVIENNAGGVTYLGNSVNGSLTITGNSGGFTYTATANQTNGTVTVKNNT